MKKLTLRFDSCLPRPRSRANQPPFKLVYVSKQRTDAWTLGRIWQNSLFGWPLTRLNCHFAHHVWPAHNPLRWNKHHTHTHTPQRNPCWQSWHPVRHVCEEEKWCSCYDTNRTSSHVETLENWWSFDISILVTVINIGQYWSILMANGCSNLNMVNIGRIMFWNKALFNTDSLAIPLIPLVGHRWTMEKGWKLKAQSFRQLQSCNQLCLYKAAWCLREIVFPPVTAS